jgi:hypothetical protein
MVVVVATTSGFVALFIVLLLGLGPLLLHRQRRVRELRLLAGRDDLDDDEIYQEFYVTSGLNRASVREIWHEIAKDLRLPAAKIRPTDRFGLDIGRYFYLSEDLDVLAHNAARRAKRLGISVDLQHLATVDGYVRAFALRCSSVTSGASL